MVRPKASKISRDVASAFALSVTTSSHHHEDLVARTGRFSIFTLFSRLAPKVCRFNEDSNACRNGISNIELNKLLEQGGFNRARVRLRGLMSAAGTSLFKQRRWLNPNSEDDRQILSKAFVSLKGNFPSYIECDETTFLKELAETYDGWERFRVREGRSDKTAPEDQHYDRPQPACIRTSSRINQKRRESSNAKWSDIACASPPAAGAEFTGVELDGGEAAVRDLPMVWWPPVTPLPIGEPSTAACSNAGDLIDRALFAAETTAAAADGAARQWSGDTGCHWPSLQRDWFPAVEASTTPSRSILPSTFPSMDTGFVAPPLRRGSCSGGVWPVLLRSGPCAAPPLSVDDDEAALSREGTRVALWTPELLAAAAVGAVAGDNVWDWLMPTER